MASGFRWTRGSPEQLARGYVIGGGKKVEQVAKAARIETEIDATESKTRCPVDTGNLRDTIHVEQEVEARRITTAIVAGGPAAPYAIKVHEDLDAFHDVGEAKFIESVVRESAPYMRERIIDRANRV